MNQKKSMRVFWLSLCLLLVSGAVLIAVAQSRAQKKAADTQDAVQRNINGNAGVSFSADAASDADLDAQRASSSAQDMPRQSTASTAQVQQTNGSAAAYVYELKVQDEYLEVYYYHTQQLFLHTGIPFYALTEEQRQDLQNGKYFRNEEELYGYLESCTS